MEGEAPHPLRLGPRPRVVQHGARDVHRVDQRALAGRRPREGAGAAPEVDDHAARSDPQPLDEGVLGAGIGALSRLVGRDLRRVLEVRAHLPELVVLPGRDLHRATSARASLRAGG